jgi:membrane peptidoglycan carboxypeptidase
VSDQPFRPGHAWVVTRILQQNMKRGTGQSAQIGCPAAGKTGTTQNFRDAWFAGYTPRTATVVWVGYPKRARPMLNVHGKRVTGSTFPAGIWRDYMKVAKGSFCGKFTPPREPAVLRPFCGRRTVTRRCDPVEPGPPPPAPIDTLINTGPPASTSEGTATFDFQADAQPTGFECSIDAAPYASCSSPVRYRGLGPGQHTFTVRAIADAPDPTPATWTWTIVLDRRDLRAQDRRRRAEERRQRLERERQQTQPSPSPPQQPPDEIIG